MYVIAIVFYCLAGLFLLYILWMCNKIRLAIAIMKAATLYMADVKIALLVPPIFFILTVATYCYWIVATIFIYATGDIE